MELSMNMEQVIRYARCVCAFSQDEAVWIKFFWPILYDQYWVLLTRNIILNWIYWPISAQLLTLNDMNLENKYLTEILKKFFGQGSNYKIVHKNHPLVIKHNYHLETKRWILITKDTFKYSILLANMENSGEIMNRCSKIEKLVMNYHLEVNRIPTTMKIVLESLLCVQIFLLDEKVPFIYKICRGSKNGDTGVNSLLRKGIQVKRTTFGTKANYYMMEKIFNIHNSLSQAELTHAFKIISTTKYRKWFTGVNDLIGKNLTTVIPTYFLPDDNLLYVNNKGALELSLEIYKLCIMYRENRGLYVNENQLPILM